MNFFYLDDTIITRAIKMMEPSDPDHETKLIISEEKQSMMKRLKRRWTVACWWKRFIYLLIALLLLGLFFLVILILVVIIRAATITVPEFAYPELFAEPAPGVDENETDKMLRAQNLAEALKIQTVSYDDASGENLFWQFHDLLNATFPIIHSSEFITRGVFNKSSLLYKVEGENNGDKLPYLLASHMDVVPAKDVNWDFPPFAGQIEEIDGDTFIYGRGTIDDKGGVMGMMEALEYMLEQGHRPQRTFFMAFGHDEEISGRYGANAIATWLRENGYEKLDFVLDEGYFVTRELVPGADQDIALIGVTEKGAVTLKLEVEIPGSHSSFPPWESCIGVLSEAVSKLEKKKLPSVLGDGPERYTFEYVAPYVSFGYRMVYANLWLFSGLMSKYMERDQLLNTIVRTTTALTIINGGEKSNVVPSIATAVVNHRVHPSQTIQEIIDFDIRVIDDERVKVSVEENRDAHPVAPFGPEDIPYHMVAASIGQTFPNTPVVPGLMVANTDTIWYLDFTDHIFRFFPTIMNEEDTLRYHGDNERISVNIYAKSVSFYHRIFYNADIMYQ
ncbi:hypothetical protein B566_EDAN015013 [Ephemera danica]|nr:hypothetical protein B566_EDAN015013 [Ephemera danica]